MNKRYKLIKRSARPGGELPSAGDHTARARRGWHAPDGTPLSPPTGTIVYGMIEHEPTVGLPFFMYDITIDGVAEHGSCYATSTIMHVCEPDESSSVSFMTENSFYTLEEVS